MKFDEVLSDKVRQRKSAPEMVADVLRQAILRGDLKGGEPLKLDELVAQFGVSRIPLREAFKQLEAEDLVTLHAYRGAVVTSLSWQEAQEICEIRLALEATAVRLAISNANEVALKQAQSILEKLENELDVNLWGEMNWEFHAALYTPADRPRLMNMLKNLHNNLDRYMRLELSVMHHQSQSQQEHWAILRAYSQHQTEMAVHLIEQHIEAGGKLLVNYLKEAHL